jgi:hypothetical protein
LSKLIPSCIANRFSKFMVFHHVSHLKVFVGYEIARFHYVQRRLDGEVFTLPANL